MASKYLLRNSIMNSYPQWLQIIETLIINNLPSTLFLFNFEFPLKCNPDRSQLDFTT